MDFNGNVQQIDGETLTLHNGLNNTVLSTAATTTYGLKFPATDGTASQVLETDGTGNLAWTSAVSGSATVTRINTIDNVIARFDGTGNAIQDSSVVISDANNITGANNITCTVLDTGRIDMNVNNMVIGVDSTPTSATGINNVTFGRESANGISGGSSNVVIGHNVGLALENGSNNVLIGESAECKGDLSNQIAIGKNAYCDNANQVCLGSNVTEWYTLTDNICALGRANKRFTNAWFSGTLTTGNLTVNGTTTTIDSTTLEVKDSTIHAAHGNPADVIDSSYYMEYNDGVVKYAGLARDATDKKFYLFKDTTAAPIEGTDYSVIPADLNAGVFSGAAVELKNGAFNTKLSSRATASYELKLPALGGAANQVLAFNGTDSLDWYTPISGATGQSLFLNYSVASDVGGYKVLSSAITLTGEVVIATIIPAVATPQLISSFATPVGFPNTTNIPSGVLEYRVHASVSSTSGVTTLSAEYYKRTAGGVETLISTSGTSVAITSVSTVTPQLVILFQSLPTSTILATDRIVVKLYGTKSSVGPIDISLQYEGSEHYSNVISTFTGLESVQATLDSHINDTTIHYTQGAITTVGTVTAGSLAAPFGTIVSMGITSSGGLTMTGTTSAFLPPKLTTAQRNAITPVAGMLTYNTDSRTNDTYTGAKWSSLLTNLNPFSFSLSSWSYNKYKVIEHLNSVNSLPATPEIPIQGTLTVTAVAASAYRGCAYSPVSNRVYLCPYGISNATTWHYYDCDTDTIGSYTAPSGIQLNAYSGCAYDSVNDRVYLCPKGNTTATWHYINCGTNTVVAYTGTAITANFYEGCVYSPVNQRVYLIPSTITTATWHYINCTTPAVFGYTAVALPANAYYGGTYCPVNDRIYMAMWTGSQTRTTLHYINCSDATVGSFAISAIGGAGSAFNGCIYSPINNRIYMCPNSNNTLWYYINCDNNTLVSYTGLLVGNFYYWGGSYSPTDDRIYLCPQQNTSTTWHYINCSTNTIGTYTVTAKAVNSFYGSSYCPVNNKIYLSPFVASNTTTWNTINITTTESPNVNLMSGAMFGSSI